MKAEGITVTVKCPLTRDNFEDRDAVRALAASLGCDCVFDLTLSAKQDWRPLPTAAGSRRSSSSSLSPKTRTTTSRPS